MKTINIISGVEILTSMFFDDLREQMSPESLLSTSNYRRRMDQSIYFQLYIPLRDTMWKLLV